MEESLMARLSPKSTKESETAVNKKTSSEKQTREKSSRKASQQRVTEGKKSHHDNAEKQQAVNGVPQSQPKRRENFPGRDASSTGPVTEDATQDNRLQEAIKRANDLLVPQIRVAWEATQPQPTGQVRIPTTQPEAMGLDKKRKEQATNNRITQTEQPRKNIQPKVGASSGDQTVAGSFQPHLVQQQPRMHPGFTGEIPVSPAGQIRWQQQSPQLDPHSLNRPNPNQPHPFFTSNISIPTTSPFINPITPGAMQSPLLVYQSLPFPQLGQLGLTAPFNSAPFRNQNGPVPNVRRAEATQGTKSTTAGPPQGAPLVSMVFPIGEEMARNANVGASPWTNMTEPGSISLAEYNLLKQAKQTAPTAQTRQGGPVPKPIQRPNAPSPPGPNPPAQIPIPTETKKTPPANRSEGKKHYKPQPSGFQPQTQAQPPQPTDASEPKPQPKRDNGHQKPKPKPKRNERPAQDSTKKMMYVPKQQQKS
jgi:hypothetical protein